ncbi:hypothetical protein NC651_022993 [Populus alba x Populus x berolinensis]|nr:hypothetical protein NC651_022993 [Populus alba x Populus x berolinensis]
MGWRYFVFNSTGLAGTQTLRILKLDLQYKCLEEPSGVFASLEHLTLNSMLVNGCLEDYHFPVLASILTRSPDLESSMTCNENRYQPDCSRKLKNKTPQFCKQREGFRNLIDHQLQEIEIELKEKVIRLGLWKICLRLPKGRRR